MKIETEYSELTQEQVDYLLQRMRPRGKVKILTQNGEHQEKTFDNKEGVSYNWIIVDEYGRIEDEL
jgi:hypothetical protein